MRRLTIHMPIEGGELAQVLAAATSLWPGSFVTATAEAMIVVDEPEGIRCEPVETILSRVLEAHSISLVPDTLDEMGL